MCVVSSNQGKEGSKSDSSLHDGANKNENVVEDEGLGSVFVVMVRRKVIKRARGHATKLR